MEAMNSALRVFISDFKPMNTKSKTGTKPFGDESLEHPFPYKRGSNGLSG
jgi:hypothetical protein